MAPVVATTSIILCFTGRRLTQVCLEGWPLKRRENNVTKTAVSGRKTNKQIKTQSKLTKQLSADMKCIIPDNTNVIQFS